MVVEVSISLTEDEDAFANRARTDLWSINAVVRF